MDLVRPAILKQISLRLSSEGGRSLYLAQDRSNGKIFTLPGKIALAVHRMKAAAISENPQTRQDARAEMDEDSTKEAYGFLHLIQSMRSTEILQKKPFNPVFASFPLMDIGPWQPRFTGLARALVSYGFLGFLLLLGAFAVVLGARNDWAIMGAFSNAFSLEAILTFGLIAPVLKIIHEFGHVLAATRFGVRVRKGGIFLIGMYPMPFVDCTEADVSTGRRQRIVISGAGIVTDVCIGLIAFIAWHFTEGSYLHTLLGNIFVFSTLNSILFNANPLIKLDGYYVLTDAIGKRNLYTRASAVMKDTRSWIASFGKDGERPKGWRHWGLLTYAVLALIYRINILWVIASALVPRYLGAGAVIAGWGALVMFVIPALREKPGASIAKPGETRRRWLWRLGLAFGLVLALMFVRFPFRVVVPVAPDGAGSYQVTVLSPGFADFALPDGHLNAGEVLASLNNPIFQEQHDLLSLQLAGAVLVYETVQGEDPAKALAAQKQVESLIAQQAILDEQIVGLQQQVPSDGVFVLSQPVMQGMWLEAGQPLGLFLPQTGAVRLNGAFPERYVTLFREGVTGLTLRNKSGYFDLNPDDAKISEVLQFDQESGSRSWQLDVMFAEQSAADFAGVPADIRVTFANAALWEHLQFAGRGLLAKYREAQLVDRSGFLDGE
ncbi:site-2 protease family protein [Halocynthiibacter sp.]|uniref:site-2 protease family protein n=1 Tax=Halocynthiibacter sp. TaxID=1979210 RepID=UPI003C3979B0